MDKLSAKEIVVEAVFEGDVASGYVSEPIKLEYETIEIRGPKELVDSVDYAQVVLKRTNLSKSVSEVLDYTLMDAEDEPVESDEIKCSVDQIGVEMPVLMVKDVALTVTLLQVVEPRRIMRSVLWNRVRSALRATQRNWRP